MKTNLAIAAMLAIASPVVETTDVSLPAHAAYEVQVPKRVKRSKPARTLARFFGYTSDRKGKGQKKREASQRRARGWQ